MIIAAIAVAATKMNVVPGPVYRALRAVSGRVLSWLDTRREAKDAKYTEEMLLEILGNEEVDED